MAPPFQLPEIEGSTCSYCLAKENGISFLTSGDTSDGDGGGKGEHFFFDEMILALEGLNTGISTGGAHGEIEKGERERRERERAKSSTRNETPWPWQTEPQP